MAEGIELDPLDTADIDAGEDIEEEETSLSLPEAPITDPFGDGETTIDEALNRARENINEDRLRALRKPLVDGFYTAIAENRGIRPTEVDYDRFEVDPESKAVYLKVGDKRVRITTEVGPTTFLKLPTIAKKFGPGGTKAIRTYLNLPDYTSKSKPSPGIELLERKVVAAAQADDDGIGAAVDDVIAALPATTQTDDGGLTLRELQGLDKALRSIRGEKAVQESKRVSLQQTLDGLRKDLERPGTTERADQIEREIEKAEDQLAATQESIDGLNFKLRSQFRQIRETLTRVFDLESDATLAERVRTLFREQGVTIASILAAIGMAISALVLALTGGGTPAPTPPPKPSDKGGVKEWFKKHLQSLGRVLANLASKAAAALPGIIGSIVSWLLNLLAKTAGWLAGNLWAVVVAVGGLLLVAAREWLA